MSFRVSVANPEIAREEVAYSLTFDRGKMSEEVDIDNGKVVFSERPIENFSTRVKLREKEVSEHVSVRR